MQMVVTRRLSFLNFSSSTPTSSSPHYHWTRLTHFGNILCDVAGIMMCPQMETQDGFEMQMGVNHLGHFYLTNLLQELLIKSSPSRIINVASSAHQICLNGLQFDDLQSRKSYGPLIAYGKSKLANILFTLELSRRLEGTCCFHLEPWVWFKVAKTFCVPGKGWNEWTWWRTGVRQNDVKNQSNEPSLTKDILCLQSLQSESLQDRESIPVKKLSVHVSQRITQMSHLFIFLFSGTGVTANSLHPGAVQTELLRSISTSYPIMGTLVMYVGPYTMAYFIKTPEEGAQTTIYCAVEESLAETSGKYFR